MKCFSYRFKKNVAFLGCLGICASCNNNIVNKHNQDDVKSGRPEGNSDNESINEIDHIDIDEDNDMTIGKKEDFFGEKEEEVKNDIVLNKLDGESGLMAWRDKFEDDKLVFIPEKRYKEGIESNICNRLYFSPSSRLIFEIISDDKVSVFGINGWEGNIVNIPEKVIILEKSRSIVKKETYSVVSMGFRAFHFYKSIERVYLPSSIKEIDLEAFEYCTALEAILIQDGVTKIGSRAFRGCKKLKEIFLPEGLIKIASEAFMDTGLKKVFIPSSVESLDCGVFRNCRIDSFLLGSLSTLNTLCIRRALFLEANIEREDGLVYVSEEQEDEDMVNLAVDSGECFVCLDKLNQEETFIKFPCMCKLYVHKSCLDCYVIENIEKGFFTCPVCRRKNTLFEKYRVLYR